jgi:porphobilinogen synthase
VDVEDTLRLGINKVLLFGVIPNEEKDERGSAGYKPDNIISRAVRALKARFPQLIVFTDICLCEYTSHGHCGLLCNCDVDNDSTLPLLAEMAYQHALAGADFVAPSAMMDGQIEALRQRLDKEGLTHTKIMAYSAKYASAYYGPFRDAAGSAPSFGDRKTYQMDYRTKDQALEEIQADIEEGTDWIMVKPALAYLDILYRASQRFPDYPLVAYQVSGEYSMLLNGARQGFFDEKRIFAESLTAIRRAGAQYIISYYAKKYVENGI